MEARHAWLLWCLVMGLAGGCGQFYKERTMPAFEPLYRSGEAALQAGDYAAARARWEQGLDLARGPDAAAWRVRFDLGLAGLDETLGRYRQSVVRAARARAAARAAKDRVLEGWALAAQGLAQRRLGAVRDAASSLDAALEIARATGEHGLEGEVRRSLGVLAQQRGDFPGALQSYQEALSLARAAGDQAGAAKALNNLGGAYRLTGDYPRALAHYQGSLELRRKLSDLGGQSRVLGNLCLVRQNLGALETAEADCRRALAISERIGDQARQANHLNNLAALARRRGDLGTALDDYRRALALAREVSDPRGEAHALNNIGEVLAQQDHQEEAVELFSKALSLKQRLGDPADQASTRLNLGNLYYVLGRYPDARRQYHRALALNQGSRPELSWRAYDALSRAYRAQGLPALAIFFGKQAVNTLQAQRAQIRTLERTLQRSFLEDKITVYRHLADLLVEQGRLPEAEQVLGMLKKEEYYDFVRGDANALGAPPTRAALTPEELDWQERYDKLVHQLGAVLAEHARLEKSGLEGRLSEAQQVRLRKLDGQLDFLYDAQDQQIAALEQALGEAPPGDAFERQLQALRKLPAVLRSLGHSTALVYYVVTDQRLHIILTGATGDVPSVWYSQAIGRTELSRRVAELREALTDASADPRPLAKSLYDALIAPIQGELQAAGIHTLMLYLDDVLRYLPLAALYDGQAYLAQRYALARYDAAANALDLKDPPAPAWRVAGLGVSQAFPEQRLPALRGVVDELDAIVKEGVQDRRGVLPGREFLDADFTPARLEAVLGSDCPAQGCYRVVHLATHFLLRPGDWEHSYLLAGDRTLLSTKELGGRHYRSDHLDLLTLSACETALSGENARGREVEGLGAAMQFQGAKAVIATLWKVADRSTALFMARFYAERQAGFTKAEALQRTQVAFITGQDTLAAAAGVGRGIAEVDPLPAGTPYSHPYFWAPFILMGNWL